MKAFKLLLACVGLSTILVVNSPVFACTYVCTISGHPAGSYEDADCQYALEHCAVNCMEGQGGDCTISE